MDELVGWLVLSPDDSFDAVFAEGGFLELGTPASVAWWVDVFVLERMGNVTGDVNAGDLASPEEVPVLDIQRCFVRSHERTVSDSVSPIAR